MYSKYIFKKINLFLVLIRYFSYLSLSPVKLPFLNKLCSLVIFFLMISYKYFLSRLGLETN